MTTMSDDCISRKAALKICRKYWHPTFNPIMEEIEKLPSAQPDNHEVACLLAELFDDTCACNFNDIDEWLPEKCEFIDSCPNPGGVTCWEQFLKHRVERKTDG